MSDMDVICIEDKAFLELMRRVIEYMKERDTRESKWVSPKEAMEILGIKSKTTLQKLRDEGLVRFTQPERRIILYDRESLYEYLEAFAKNPFALKRIGFQK